jgi:signal transduction histidine kinase
MWVCFYALAMVFLTMALSILVLREMDARQRRLSADVAHELRTPLTCLKGSMEALIDGVWEATPERLASCSEEIDRLDRLVSDISLLTDIEWEHVKLEKAEFDLAALLEATAGQFEGQAALKDIRFMLDTETCTVFADYNRMKQVFVNIISNAVKYTEHGSITLKNRGREVVIADTGAGISPEDLPHIFERFYRADKSRDRASGGSGVGLTIAGALVKAHGGSIRAESAPGKGTVFFISI